MSGHTQMKNQMEKEPTPRFFCFRMAVKQGISSPAREVLVYLAATVDLVVRAPVLTAAVILWAFLAIKQFNNPALLWFIIPVWCAMAIPPTVWALRAARKMKAV